ncbi:Lipid A export ATP-binding/permease protein MsbA [Candidatus Desulfarcum epimagneticum]|uniref:Lipid A export ATP-binding/permease protein MsbA n=1 Tax=uncultured Desulfobacteraceae bacterium TaxID=218296 RepID=A0A484HD46_9BACT|nr:Lipid A export ATP-binding/permease protein MsbA [uncultured Desulfobacteraceae bacterium]
MSLFPSGKIKPRHRRLLRLVFEKRFKLFGAMLCSLAISLSTAGSAYLIKNVIDDIFVNKDVGMLKALPVVVLAMYFFRGIGIYGQDYFMSHIGESIIRRLRDDLYGRIMDLPLSFFHREKTGGLMSRITNDATVIRAMVSDAVKGSLRDFFTILFLTAVIFYREWELALFAIIILPAAFLPVVKFGRKVRRFTGGRQEALSDINVFLHETFAGNKIVKAFGMEKREKKRFFEKTRALFKIEIRTVIAKALSPAIMEALAGVGIAFIIGYGGYRVINGTSTAGTFFSFMAAVLMLYDPVKKLSRINNTIQEGMAAADRVFDIIETPREIKDPEKPALLPPGPHAVAFEDVSFKYQEKKVLKNIDLRAEPGEMVAIVGKSGAGKTTLVNMIPRFYDVFSGAIKIGGVDIRDMSLTSLRKQIAIVTQEPILFNDTIRNNIAYGAENPSDADVEKAAKSAYAYDFIQNFPDGFDTLAGELGARLSGGEKQRICIARALMKNAPILILDEATSSLDSSAERIVQKALDNLMKGRCAFVIAHRLSTVRNAHRIVAMEDGRIVEHGKHEELMAARGQYYELCRIQFKK